MGNSQSLDGALQHPKDKNIKNPSSALNESTQLPHASTDKIDNESNSHSKKKFLRLGTLRRKIAKTLRPGKNSDFRKHIRDLLQHWSLRQIQCLVKDYDGLEALKELVLLANSARQKCNKLQDDLLRIHKEEILSDLVIIYNGVSYPVHRSIVCCRCPYFSNYLTKCQNDSGRVVLNTPELCLSKDQFSSLLKYIYTGRTSDKSLIGILGDLGEKFGMLKAFSQDFQMLLENKKNADVVLVYPNTNHSTSSQCNLPSQAGLGSCTIDRMLEITCHTAVLAARSKYFRNLLSKKRSEKTANDTASILRLTIDEKVIPRCFVRIVLACFYTDVVDLSTVIKWKVDDGGVEGADRLLTVSELAMELYEIGNFLEFPALMKSCEDTLVENLNVSCLLNVLEWSSQCYGSSYVYRQSVQYFQQEFMQLCRVPLFLCNIPKAFLWPVIKSDYLQATEEFLLASLIKWGEWQIAKANEQTGNNSPGNSLPRRSPKRREINNNVLRELIAPLLSHVRLKHVLPRYSSVLHMAYQRGLLQKPFPFDVVASEKLPSSVVYWIQGMRYSEYVKPRLFMQYVYEAKIILRERFFNENETPLSTMEPPTCLPDMLPRDVRPRMRNVTQTCDLYNGGEMSTSFQYYQCQLDESLIKQMVLLEKEYKMAEEAVKAFSLMPDCGDISMQIQLRVIRECGLSDEMATEVFQQVPDVVDSMSSTNSSKHNSLSKVRRLLQAEDQLSLRSYRTFDNSVDRKTSKAAELSLEAEIGALTSLRLEEDNALERGNTLSFASSPLDLPLREEIGSFGRDTQLPNVLLDT